MTRRILPVVLAAAVAVGLTWADEPPPDQGEPPVRLKKKNKPGAEEPPKPPAGEDKEKMKEQPKEDEPQPDEPEQDEKEVLQRVGKNMRSVEERLGNKELNEGTRQVQEDIVKDLDSLIRISQRQQNQSNNDSAESNSSPDGGQKPSGSQSQGKQQSRSGGRKGGSQMAKGQKPGGRQTGSQGDQSKDQMANNAGGNRGGAGGTSPSGPDRNADLYKDVWGHLPEALRAEMNAYSNPQAFMGKYDEMIKKYYTTIAEKGRRKGD